ncbi:MAG TPA: helix-turn-helix transcriptional regulator [Hanamia sp.]|nr:helix-turn-helix transcriptional regulator [Hanamia sp.]
MIYSQQIETFVNVDVKLKIGQRIKELREQANMSQKDLSYSADLDRSYIASIENGQRNVSIVNIEKIATALNVTLTDFFKPKYFENTSTNKS